MSNNPITSTTLPFNSQTLLPGVEMSAMIRANRRETNAAKKRHKKCSEPTWGFTVPAVYEHLCMWCGQDISYVRLANGEDIAFDVFVDENNERRIDLAKTHFCDELPDEPEAI